MTRRKVSKRKIFIFISLLICFVSIIVYGYRFIHYYRIENSNKGEVESAK